MSGGSLSLSEGAATGAGEWADGRAVLAAHALVFALAMVPLLIVDVPALADYPNHLARMHILANLDRLPGLQAIYAVDWDLLPNLAMDALVPPLARLIGAEAASRLFLAATLALNVAGVAAVHRALYGRVGLWPLAAYLVLFNYVMGLGFLNYLFGVGLALSFLALWIAGRGWPPVLRLGLSALGAAVLFFCHLAAFATYALCVAGYEAWLVTRRRPIAPGRLLWRVGLAGLPFLPCVALLVVSAPTAAGQLEPSYNWYAKLTAPLVPLRFYGTEPDPAYLFGVVILLALALRRRALRIAPALRLPLAGLGLAVLLVPTWAAGNWGNDFRLAVPLVLLAIAGCRLEADGATLRLLAAGAGVLFVLRLATLTGDWVAYDRLYAELRDEVHGLPAGARVLPAVSDWSKIGEVAPNGYRRLFYNVPTLLILDQPVFVPSLFTAKGRQPLSVQPQLAAIDAPHLKPLPLTVLRATAVAKPNDPTAPILAAGDQYSRYQGWPAQFDYVLMLDFGAHANPLPGLLTPLSRGSYFTLYAIGGEAFSAAPVGGSAG